MSIKNTTDKSVKRNTGADLKAMAEAKFAARQAAQQPKTPREQLDEFKATVRKGLMDFVEVGTALGLISKLNLFKEDGYASFAEFVEGEFQMSRAWAYRQVDAARVVTQLSQVETNDLTVVNQAQALELAPLVRSVEAMATVVRTAKARGPVTADTLKAVRVELYPNPKVIEGEIVPDRPAVEAKTSAGTVAPTETEHGAGTPEDSVSGDGDGTSPVAVPTQTSVDQADIDGRVSVRTQEERTDEPGEVASSASPGPQDADGVPQVATPQVPDADREQEQSGEGASSPGNLFAKFRDDMLGAWSAFKNWHPEAIAELGPVAFDLYIDVTDYIAAQREQVVLAIDDGGGAP